MLENFSVKNWQNGIHGIGLEISSDCNLRCKYCYYYRENRKDDPTSIVKDTDFYSNIGNILDKVFSDFVNVDKIEFWGAEPLLHIKRIKYVIDYIIDTNKFTKFSFLISSNMAHTSNIYDDLFDMFDYFETKLKNIDFKLEFSLQTSIDFPREIHDKNRVTANNNPTFNKVKKNYLKLLKRLGSKKYNNVAFSTFTKSTYDYKSIDIKKIENIPIEIYNEILKDLPILCDTKSAYSDFGFNIDYFATPATGIDYDLDDGFKNYIYYKNIFDEFDTLYLTGKITYANAMFFLPGSLRIFIYDLLNLTNSCVSEYPVCRSGVSFIGVKNNGDIFPCHHFFSVKNRLDFSLGNILTNEYNVDMIETTLNTFFLIKETFKDFETDVFMPKYSKNLKYGSLNIISDVFYKSIIRHFCFAENCEHKGNWSAIDLDSILKLYPVEWLELVLNFITKYRKVFEAIDDKIAHINYDLG